MKKINIIGEFNSFRLAESCANHTIKMSSVILGDNGKFWVVNMANMEKAIRNGYEVAV